MRCGAAHSGTTVLRPPAAERTSSSERETTSVVEKRRNVTLTAAITILYTQYLSGLPPRHVWVPPASAISLVHAVAAGAPLMQQARLVEGGHSGTPRHSWVIH